jgi:hypothetical protein
MFVKHVIGSAKIKSTMRGAIIRKGSMFEGIWPQDVRKTGANKHGSGTLSGNFLKLGSLLAEEGS